MSTETQEKRAKRMRAWASQHQKGYWQDPEQVEPEQKWRNWFHACPDSTNCNRLTWHDGDRTTQADFEHWGLKDDSDRS